MIYVYAIIQPPGDLPLGLRGLNDQPLHLHTAGDVCSAYSRDHEATPSPTPANLWRHEQVVEAIMRHCPLLPARFGTTFPHERQLEEALSHHQSRLAAGLERVRGCVELGVRVFDKAPAKSTVQSDPTSGRDYMLTRLAAERRRRQAEERAARIHDALAPFARDQVQRVLPSAGLLMTAA